MEESALEPHVRSYISFAEITLAKTYSPHDVK